MRAVIQRVRNARVIVDGSTVSQIGPGLLCLIGIGETDVEADVEFISRKILNIRLWASEKRAWDKSVTSLGYDILCVSQFTLYGRLKGNAVDFGKAMTPNEAREFYHQFLDRMKRDYLAEKIHDGVFGAKMEVESVNDGPVTIVLDSVKPS